MANTIRIQRKENALIDLCIEKGKVKRDEEYSPQTKKTIKIDLEQLCYWLEVDNNIELSKLSSFNIVMFFEFLKKEGAQIRTLRRKYASINVLLNYLGKKELMDSVEYPMEIEKHKSKEDKRLTEKQISKILRRLEKRSIKKDGTRYLEGYCYRALIRMLLYSPIKTMDIFELKRENFFYENNNSYVIVEDKNELMKNKITIPQELSSYILEYLEERDRNNHLDIYLFQSRLHKKMESRSVLDFVTRLGKECKIDNLTITALRSSYWYLLSKEIPLCDECNLVNEKLDISIFH